MFASTTLIHFPVEDIVLGQTLMEIALPWDCFKYNLHSNGNASTD